MTDTPDKEKPVFYVDYQLQMLFEGLCEQALDYLGLSKGKAFLYENFKGFEKEIDIKINAYLHKKRITRKLDKPDPEIVKICEGWK